MGSCSPLNPPYPFQPGPVPASFGPTAGGGDHPWVANIRGWAGPDGKTGKRLYLWCVGCNEIHGVEIDPTNSPCWTWNGSLIIPTIDPSLRISGAQWDLDSPFFRPRHPSVPEGGPICCHSFIRDGKWEYLSDSTHILAGQTVPCPPLVEWSVW